MNVIPKPFLLALAQERCLSESEIEVLLYAVEDKSPNAIAQELHISAEAVRKRLSEVYKKFKVSGTGPGKLTKLQQVIADEYQASLSVVKPNSHVKQDWVGAPSIYLFYGRVDELRQLQEWIVKDKCRLVAILGMGGIGKTSLSVKLATQVQENFEYLIWRSLRNAPPLKELLANLINFISNQQNINLPESTDERLTQLINYLRKHRCLLVLDNAETILQGGDRAGYYRPGYEDYGQLLKRIGEELHQSCLLLTSREKPKEFAPLEGEVSPVRTISLVGLGEKEGQDILKDKGLCGTNQAWTKLVENYSGNPLALKLVSEPIRELFGGDIDDFLDAGEIVFGDTRHLLDQQFERTSKLEKEVIYWLAIKRELVSLEDLLNDIVHPFTKRELLESLESLRRRSLIEKSAGLFTLQSVVMEYIIDRLIEQIPQEVTTGKITLFMSHALIEATAKDNVRDIQIRLILKPVIERFLNLFRSPETITEKLTQILQNLKDKSALQPGYAAGNVINLLCHLKVNLSNYDFSYLSVWQAYLQGVNLHNVNFAYSDLSKSVFTQSLGPILSVALSQDGKLCATGDANNLINVFKVADGQLLFTFEGHNKWIRSVTFSPDGRLLASGSDDQTVRLWDVHTGKYIKTLSVDSSRVRSVAFSPDSQLLASGSDDQMVKLWNVNDGTCILTLPKHSDWVWSVTFSPDGKLLASGSEDKTIKLWNVSDGTCLKTLQEHTYPVWSVAFSPDGKLLTSGSEDKTIKLWNVSDGTCLKTLQGHTSWVWSVAFSPDGKLLASGSDDQTVKLWNVSDGNCLITLQGHSNCVRSIAFSSDGKLLASASEDQTVKLWNISDGNCLKTWQGYINWARSVAFSPDGTTLASTIGDKTVKLWNVHTRKSFQILQGHTSWVRSVAFSPDGCTLASGSEDKTVKLWNVSDGNCIKTLKGHASWVQSVAFSSDSRTLASSSDDKTVKLWNQETGTCLNTFKGHDNRVQSIAFSPYGKCLVSGSEDQTVKLWNLQTGDCLKTFLGHTGWVRSVAFSPDGKLLASGSEDKTVKLWDVQTGECLHTLTGHTSWVRSVAFSYDGNILASGGDDQTVRLWDVHTGKPLKVLAEHKDWVCSVVFSPDGCTLASGSQDETIKLWDVNTGDCFGTLTDEKPYKKMNITAVTGLTPAQVATLKALGALEEQQKK
ncbi:WD-40 repeat-containing protein [Calothrix sp. NIES-2100]|uniref:WD40 domain-containing protein n=1 Tax=Calothrix sp. NIES-2100 TaxID=1954172 RepID=UPI000B61A5DA|nr:WD-40 repeat-containing protein [Calothrix sp. NIES-2100]